jgi:hypothetical protein
MQLSLSDKDMMVVKHDCRSGDGIVRSELAVVYEFEAEAYYVVFRSGDAIGQPITEGGWTIQRRDTNIDKALSYFTGEVADFFSDYLLEYAAAERERVTA